MTYLRMNPPLNQPEPDRTASNPFPFAEVLLDSIASGVMVIGASRQILALNPVAERLVGLSAGHLLNRSMSALPPGLQAVIDEAFVTGNPVSGRTVLLPQSGRPDELLQVNTHLGPQDGGGGASVLVELQNAGQAKNIATNLEHLDRLASLGVLSAGMAHEIKNALVSVRTFFDLLAEQAQDPELTRVAAREIQRIDTVVRQVLRGATRGESTLAPLAVQTLLRECLQLLHHPLHERSIELVLDLSAPRDRVNGDERQLRQALINLLMNALEAMGPRGRLTVTSSTMEMNGAPHLRLTISDTGSGISPEHLARLFSPFFTTKKEGTGIGLAITRRIIHDHHGAITVESKIHVGTTFQIFLPLL
jgi:signal transduction histidine kinase